MIKWEIVEEVKIEDEKWSHPHLLKEVKNEGWFSRNKDGAKWAIHNLTDEEIKYLRENGDKDDFSFAGLWFFQRLYF